MSTNICNTCGANLIYKDGRWVCPACGAYKEEEISNEEVTLLYNASQKLRLASFDDAEELYADIVKKYPKNSEAHWGLVLSRYGIKYEDDYDGRKLPTCYAATMESFLDDKEYLAALSCAPDAKVKAYYAEQGKIIEKNRIEWYEKASKEPAYDVFLCFKDSDKENNIERTDDSIEVANLYTYLSGKGYRVFFSRETLRDKVAEKYEPYIYNALNTASVMIVYGSKPEYFESVWMKNEWTRFLKRMREGLKVDGSLIVAYDGMNPAELPKVFAGRQCLDARKKTFYGDLETLIARVIAIAKRPKAAVERIEIKGAVGRKKTSVGTQIKTIQAGGAIGKKAPIAVNTGVATREIGQYEVPELTPDEETKTKTVFRFLSAGLFDNAQKVVEEILEKNHYNSRALFAKLLIHYEAKNETELAGKLSAVDDFEEIKTVIAYNDKSIGEKIIAALSNQVLSFMERGEYDKAISYLHEIAPYNSETVVRLKAQLKQDVASLLGRHPDVSEKLFATLLETYTDADSYIPYIQEYVNNCLQSNRLSIAKKYNDKVVELDDGNLNATLVSMYLSVPANSLADFIEKADAFTEFAMLDSALRKFDADEVDGFFATMEKIISGLIGRQANGDAICRWFDFVTKYEFAGRQDLIRTTMASLAELSDCKKRSKLFDSILACIDSADVDQHITLRMEYAASMQGAGEFSLAEKYYKQVLDIEEGNCDAMFGRILCHYGAKSEQELPGTVDQFEDFKSFETLLRYCPDEENRCKYLGFVLSAINERSKGVTDKATIARLAGVFDGIVKYYPEERNKELLSYTMQFAANAKNSAAFETAEKYYAVALSIDHLCHEAYLGLLQAKLSCRNNDDLIHQKTLICDMPEFYSAIAAVGDDDRSADRYVKLAKEQKEYIEKKVRFSLAMIKRLKIAMPALVLALALVLIAVGAFFTIKNAVIINNIEETLRFTENPDGSVSVAGLQTQQGRIDIIDIPSEWNGKKVVSISKYAFNGYTGIKKVVIPYGVTDIGEYAFSGCRNLTSITIPNSVTKIEDFTFLNCISLASVTIPESVISIGMSAFEECVSLTSITIPDSVTKIGDDAFSHCSIKAARVPDFACSLIRNSKLQSVIITSGTVIEANAFFGCTRLTTVEIPDSVIRIQNAAFSNCISLNSITIPESVISIGASAFSGCIGLTDITIPNSVSDVGSFAFSGCVCLKSVALSSSLTNISNCAFHNCRALTEIRIPDGVITIDSSAFSGCSSLTSIVIPNGVTAIEDYAFFGCSKLISIEIPDGVRHIASYAFSDCESLTTITIPESVTSIDDYAFSGCSGLLTITIPSSVTSINNSVFARCTGLTGITIPTSVRQIAGSAFYGCNSLTSITIPATVTSVGTDAFASCSNLTNVTIFGTGIDESVFSGCPIETATIPASACASIRNTNLKTVIITKGTSIADYAFDGCTSLTSITIPDSVTLIGSYAFRGCSSLKSVTIPESVKCINPNAFDGWKSSQTIYCKATSKPSGWYTGWKNNCSATVVWGA